METTYIKTEDGNELFFYSYTSERKPKLILQFAHGMGEHAGRYHEFFQYLLDHDIFVFANDHRGHGKTVKKNGVLGHYDDNDGFEKAVQDLKMIHDDIHMRYADTSHVIMGHSMGSFLVRRFIEHYPDAKEAVILSGTGYHQGVLGKVGRFLSSIESKVFGATHRSKLLDRFSFGQYQRHFKNRGSWLSRDEKIVAAYREDPLSGYVATSQFYYDLLTGIETLHKKQELRKVNKHAPILVISGEEDPVGGFSKGVKRVVDEYKQIGVETVDVILYPEGRHEMLFETNRAEVTEDVYQWLISTLH